MWPCGRYIVSMSLYIHVPYCRRKCPYCDFYSAGVRIADWSAYVGAVLRELDARRQEHPENPDSIYIGGGTPSLIPPAEFLRLAEGIRARFDFSCLTPEFTIEVNPDDVTQERVDAWLEGGVNRVSVGVQSFDDSDLRQIGRGHTGAQARKALETLADCFHNVSADLMFALPGQTIDRFRANVGELMSLSSKIRHISAYALMFEEGTAMTRLRDENRIEESDDELYVAMFEYLSDTLTEAGYRQYEISNYATPGYESRHNSGYWSGKRYLGLGPSAHSYDGSATRRANPPRLYKYLEAAESGFATPFYIEENLSRQELMEEYILTRMRTMKGIDTEDYRKRFGDDALRRLMLNARGPVEKGLLHKETPLRLTRKGVMLSDEVILSLI